MRRRHRPRASAIEHGRSLIARRTGGTRQSQRDRQASCGARSARKAVEEKDRAAREDAEQRKAHCHSEIHAGSGTVAIRLTNSSGWRTPERRRAANAQPRHGAKRQSIRRRSHYEPPPVARKAAISRAGFFRRRTRGTIACRRGTRVAHSGSARYPLNPIIEHRPS